MVHISEISFKNRKNCTYLYDLDHEKTTTINNRLPSENSGWLANPGGTKFPKPIEEISQEELNAFFFVSPHLQGLQLQKFIYEIRTSRAMFVSFPRHHTAKHL